MKKLTNKRALVCGASQGIGQAIAIELARDGANVTLLARSDEKLKKTLSCLDNDNQQHDAIVLDLANTDQLQQTIQNYVHSKPVDILINNAGGPPPGPAHKAKVDEFVSAFNMHLLASHVLSTACIDHMKSQQFGRIINIISTSVKQPIPGLGVSNTIRGAVANWAKSLASELGAYGITVNNVLPGATQTSRLEGIIENKSIKSGRSVAEVIEHELNTIPAHRFGQPEELAHVVHFLVSAGASYVNGVNIPVDGGRTQCL